MDEDLTKPTNSDEGIVEEPASGENNDFEFELELPEDSEGTEEENTADDTEKLSKRLADKDRFIDKRNAEVGALRKETREKDQLIQLLQLELQSRNSETDDLDRDALREKFLEDPVAALEEIDKHKSTRKHDAKKLRDERVLKAQEGFQNIFRDTPLEDLKEDMANILKSDGAPDDLVEMFREDFMGTGVSSLGEATLLNLAKRAELTRENTKLREALLKMKRKPDEILNRIEKAEKAVTPGSTSVPGKRKISSSDMAHPMMISSADRKKMIEQLERQLN